MTNSIGEVTGADALFIIGSNTTETHPVIGYRVRKAARNGTKVVVADPRRIDLAKRSAVLHLQQKPGTDVALLNGMLNVIISENLVDKTFINSRTEGFADVEKVVSQYTPEYASEITGVPAEDIKEAARIYGNADKAAILYTMGITQHTSGTDNVLAIANLAMATGNLGKPSAGVNPLRGQNNVQGACDMGALPNVFTGYQKVGDENSENKFAQNWNVQLDSKPGLAVPEMFDQAAKGELKAMYIMGENPVMSDANASHVIEALENLELLVVQDIFLTETAQYADVVFPAASFAEKMGTYTNTERRVQIAYPAVNPPGEALPDYEILTLLANRIGFNWRYDSAEDIFTEITSLTPSYAGINYGRLEQGGLQWPCPDESHPGTMYLHGEEFKRGKGLFNAVEFTPPAEEPDKEYPFILTTGRNLFHYHTGTMTYRSQGLVDFKPEEDAMINSVDAQNIGVESGDEVEVTSRRGRVKAKANVSEIVAPGVIFMTFHYRDTLTNMLTNDAIDPVSKTPELKVSAVNVKKT